MGYQLILNISYKLNRTYRTILLYTADGNYNHERHYPGDSRHFASADHDSDHRIHVGILPADGDNGRRTGAGGRRRAGEQGAPDGRDRGREQREGHNQKCRHRADKHG